MNVIGEGEVKSVREVDDRGRGIGVNPGNHSLTLPVKTLEFKL